MSSTKTDEYEAFYEYFKRKILYVNLLAEVKKYLKIEHFLQLNPDFNPEQELHKFNKFLEENNVQLKYFLQKDVESQRKEDYVGNKFIKPRHSGNYLQRIEWVVNFLLNESSLSSLFYDVILWEVFGKKFDFKKLKRKDQMYFHCNEHEEYMQKEIEDFDMKNPDADPNTRDSFLAWLEPDEDYMDKYENSYPHKIYFSEFTRKEELLEFINRNWKEIKADQEKYKIGFTKLLGRRGRNIGDRSEFEYLVADILYANKTRPIADIRKILEPFYHKQRDELYKTNPKQALKFGAPPQTKDLSKMLKEEIKRRED